MASKVWFITGTSKGFGRVWAEAALERGDLVAATARNLKSLDSLVSRYGDRVAALTLDVTDKAAVATSVSEAHQRFGRIDIAVNNAGYGLFGAIEEVSEAEARAQIETNLFGALWVTQAVLPLMRGQRSGHILQVSSIGGVNAFPTVGLYHASKWALEGFSQSLAAEVAPLGYQGDSHRAGGICHRMGWGVRFQSDTAAGVRRRANGRRGLAQQQYSGRPASHRARDPEGRGCQGASAASVLRLGGFASDPRGVCEAPRDLGEMERRGRRGAG